MPKRSKTEWVTGQAHFSNVAEGVWEVCAQWGRNTPEASLPVRAQRRQASLYSMFLLFKKYLAVGVGSVALFVSNCTNPNDKRMEQNRSRLFGRELESHCSVVADCVSWGQTETEKLNKNQGPAPCFACCNDDGPG